MDSLDNYKKVWDNQPKETNKVSKVDIYKMSQSKSSSIVKWIFIIGLLELVVPFLILLFMDFDRSQINKNYEELGLKNYMLFTQIIVYPAIAIFLYLFYRNYKNISTTDTTKELMNKILKTRKTVKIYIFFGLGYAFLTLLVVTIQMVQTQLANADTKTMMITTVVTIFVGLIIICGMWLIYQLLYGILLRKLYKNYKELAKLDSIN